MISRKQLDQFGAARGLDPRRLRRVREMPYAERAMVQLELWVQGRSVHNDIENECVPDFSCCRGPESLAPLALRERFRDKPQDRKGLQEYWLSLQPDAFLAGVELDDARIDAFRTMVDRNTRRM